VGVRRRLVALLAATLAAAGLVACSQDDVPPGLHLSWHEGDLPAPASERVVVRAATWCAGRWVVVGATADERGHTRPAVWSSTDAVDWRAVRLHPGQDYYAARAILYSVGCARGRLAVLGAKSGGAHGNPRTATWHERSDGSLAAVPAAFELFGGPNAVSVSRLTGGPGGYLIAGTRTGGATVWTSRTGDQFRIHEDAPGLASTGQQRTQALDAVWWHDAWTVSGIATDGTGRSRATVWRGSGDGAWAASRLPGGKTITTAERLSPTDEGPLAVGFVDSEFGVWAEGGEGWSLVSTFGRQDPDATSAAYVSAVAWTGSVLAAAYSDGTAFRLAVGPAGDPAGVPLPVPVAVGGDSTVSVAAHGSSLLLLADDGSGAHVWLARAA
jgi:hypothetical protein